MWALKILHEKNWRVCLCVQEGTSSSTKFSLNSFSHSGISELARPESANNGCPRSIMVSFLFVFVCFGFAWSTTGCPVLSSTVVDTGTGKVSLSVRFSHSRVSLSLDVAVGDEDEHDEDVQQ